MLSRIFEGLDGLSDVEIVDVGLECSQIPTGSKSTHFVHEQLLVARIQPNHWFKIFAFKDVTAKSTSRWNRFGVPRGLFLLSKNWWMRGERNGTNKYSSVLLVVSGRMLFMDLGVVSFWILVKSFFKTCGWLCARREYLAWKWRIVFRSASYDAYWYVS